MAAQGEVKKAVLAYSGGLDTSVILPWLRETYGCKVVAFVADVGQGLGELGGIVAKAKASGACEVYVEDLRDEFVTDYLWPMLKAGAVYEGKYLLGTSIARPLIAKKQVEVARATGADAVAHGATGKGNDQVRFELTFMALAPDLKVLVPWRDSRWTLTSREAAVEYAEARGIPIAQSKKSIYSRDRNLWHISHEGAELESPANEPSDDVFVLSTPVSKTPNKAEVVEVEFAEGVPVGVNGKRMAPVAIVEALNVLGGKHGVGQVDLVENRLVGIKSRGVYETPGGTILYAAHAALEAMCLDRDTLHYKQVVALRYAELVYYGQWFSMLRESIDAFVNRTQRTVTGRVRLRLYKGHALYAGATSPHSLYNEDLASFVMGKEYDPTDATGFIHLFGLPMKVQGLADRQAAAKAKGKAKPKGKSKAKGTGKGRRR
ncbi:MAG: argininosuccinate synthase [Planctomycetes bacterium]|nr:argininosuccinate synthase [Planctomycetota bacterium]